MINESDQVLYEKYNNCNDSNLLGPTLDLDTGSYTASNFELIQLLVSPFWWNFSYNDNSIFDNYNAKKFYCFSKFTKIEEETRTQARV